jgi:hypothetical protein
VTPLVHEADDMFAIMASGDECTLRWKETSFPRVPSGWTRTWFFAFEGWSKDGDPNTVDSGHVEPLPFHGMSGYPYGPDEAYPSGEEHRMYRSIWNTREGIRLTRDLAGFVGPETPIEIQGSR